MFTDFNDSVMKATFDIYKKLIREKKFLAFSKSEQDLLIFDIIPSVLSMSERVNRDISFETILNSLNERGGRRYLPLLKLKDELEIEYQESDEGLFEFKNKARNFFGMNDSGKYRRQKFDIKG